jgi:hypothetical protein
VDEYVVYLEFLASRMFNAADKVGEVPVRPCATLGSARAGE